MAYDLSGNTELKNATFAPVQKPIAKFYWKDGVVGETDFSDDLISLNGTIELEGDFGEPTKNSFNVVLANEVFEGKDGQLKMYPGNWYVESTGSINEKVRVETGYDHAGAGAKTIVQTRGKVRSVDASTSDVTATLFAVDEGKNFDRDVSHAGILKNKYPHEILSDLITDVNSLYGTSLTLTVKSLDPNPSIDESLFFVKYFAYAKEKGWDIVQRICEASMGKFFINRSGNCEYWTYNYWQNKVNNSKTTYDFTASTDITTSGEIIPILQDKMSIANNGIINKVEANYYDFMKVENKLINNTVTFEIPASGTFNAELYFSDKYIETLGTTTLWFVQAYTNADYLGIDYGTSLTLSNVNNFAKGLTFTVTNADPTYYYCKVTPYSTLHYEFLEKTKKLKENGTSDVDLVSWVDGDYNYKLNDEKSKSINNILVQNKSWADNLCYKYIDLFRKPYRELNIKTTGMPQLDVGDVIYRKNYKQYKSTEAWGMVKAIKWNIDGSTGYISDLFIQVQDSTSGLLNLYLFDYFTDTSKTDVGATSATVSGGEVTATLSSGGFTEDTLINFIHSSLDNSDTQKIDTVNTTSLLSSDGFTYCITSASSYEDTTYQTFIFDNIESSDTQKIDTVNTTSLLSSDGFTYCITSASSYEDTTYKTFIFDNIESSDTQRIDTGATDAVYSAGSYICKGGAGAYATSKFVTINYTGTAFTDFQLITTQNTPTNTSITYEYSLNNGGSYTSFTKDTWITVSSSTQLKVRISLNTTSVSATPALLNYNLLTK